MFVCCASGTKGTVTAANRQLVEQLVPLFSILIRRCSCKAHLVLPRKVSFDLLIFTLIDYLRFKSISRERVRRGKRAGGLFYLASVCATLPNVLPPHLRWQQFSNVLKRRKFLCRCSQHEFDAEVATFYKRSNTFMMSLKAGLRVGFFKRELQKAKRARSKEKATITKYY